ncbi:hypothetical protein C8D87_101584 [Lentzea atacamensis]|uniref:Uncharacterized protein n=1 Tax=Lentzea atacamensis TaxID=531938 RepID=A0ABX9EJF6_9PSEU|nr:hypothetical protein C8D87_101584 [Lentzea atacamensis]
MDGGHRHAGRAGAADHGIVTGFPHWWQVAVYSTGALLSLLVLFTIQEQEQLAEAREDGQAR